MSELNSQASMNKKKAGVIVLGALAATAAAYLLSRAKAASSNHEKPPKGAPQLHIENPGSQHDFPKPPIESEMG